MKRKTISTFSLWLASGFIILIAMAAQAQNVIKIQTPTDGNGNYAVAMAKLALSKIENNYKIELIDSNTYTQARSLEEVAAGNMDIMWTATDQELEDKLLPIRIPLYKGLLGHRIFIIRKGDQARFNRVRNFDDLKQFKFGQGTTWADSKILAANGLTVIKAMKYESLFHMLDGNRFDAFPRGVQEPWAEIASHPGLPLAAETHIMFVYRMPFYLFTNKKNKKLAQDLELGFNRAIADSSFDKLFYSSPIVQSVMDNANLDSRIIFELKNPTLPKETPIDRPELWLNIENFKTHMRAAAAP